MKIYLLFWNPDNRFDNSTFEAVFKSLEEARRSVPITHYGSWTNNFSRRSMLSSWVKAGTLIETCVRYDIYEKEL